MPPTSNSKRIAKNTIFLYFRMSITMLVNLYVSRIVLDILGVSDYGIYNVIGGFVTMFTIINFAMSNSTSRFITFELGKKNLQKLNLVFNTSVIIHIGIAIIILILSESIGLWFLNLKMVIPESRMIAANWVFQFSVLSTMVMILSAPYNALIISHEKMNAFAYISIIETILKLISVYLLVIGGFDKLIYYAILMFFNSLVIRILYQIYCTKVFKHIKLKFASEKKIRKEMFEYASWSLIGSSSVLLANHGQNILLNIFFGPAVNAARGIAVQVQNAIQQFSGNFQQAMNPQINKSYAVGDLKYMHSLIYASSKYSYYLLFVLSLPVYFEIETILEWWLKEVPEHSANFIRIMLIIAILTAISNPLSVAAGANGKIRNYQLVVGGVMLLIVPFSYFVLKLFPKPENALLAQVFVATIGQIIRLLMVKPLIHFSLKKYFSEVVLRCFIVTLLSIIIPLIAFKILHPSLISSILICAICLISSVTSIYFAGLTSNEKKMVENKLKVLTKKNRISV